MKQMRTLAFGLALTSIGLGAGAQSPDPAYVGAMPTVDYVKSRIKGTDDLDSACRQLGALWQLADTVEAIARKQGRPLWPGEQKLDNGYTKAYVGIREPIDRSLPDAAQRAFYFKHRGYETNPAFLDVVLRKVVTRPQRLELYKLLGKTAPPLPPGADEEDRPEQPGSATAAQPSAPAGGTGTTRTRALSPADQSARDAAVTRGNALRDASKYAEALVYYKRALAIDPECAMAHFSMAICYDGQEQWALAVDSWRRAIRLMQLPASAYLILGNDQEGIKKYDDALASYKQAIAMKPKPSILSAAYYDEGLLLKQLERYNEAVPPLQEAVRLSPSDANNQLALGGAYFDTNRYADAAKALEAGVKLKPTDANSQMLLGEVYLLLGKVDGAERIYRALLPLDKQMAASLRKDIDEARNGKS